MKQRSHLLYSPGLFTGCLYLQLQSEPDLTEKFDVIVCRDANMTSVVLYFKTTVLCSRQQMGALPSGMVKCKCSILSSAQKILMV